MKTIYGLPDYTISKDGIVRLGAKRIPTSNVEDSNGIFMLAYEIEDRIMQVRDLISSAYFGGRLLLPRDGNFFNWNEHNQIVVSHLEIDGMVNFGGRNNEDITFMWWMYHRSFTCEMIASEKKLGGKYTRDIVFSVIRDVMVLGIR
jgi:hypothetical protein